MRKFNKFDHLQLSFLHCLRVKKISALKYTRKTIASTVGCYVLDTILDYTIMFSKTVKG